MKQFIAAIAAAALMLTACTTAESGKPFDQLPEMPEGMAWTFFAALPSSDLPAELADPESRVAFRQRFIDMQDGILGDGDDLEGNGKKNDNSIYWSDYFSKPEDYDWSQEDEDTPHPYAHFHVYPGTEEGKYFGILECGAYTNGDDTKEPVRAYWYNGSKVQPGKITVEPMYNADNVVPDPLVVFGSDELHFALKDGRFGPSYYDRGFEIYIEDVGTPGVEYEWDGVRFNRIENPVCRFVYSYGFSHIMLGEDIPWSIPGYITETVNSENPFDRIINVTRKGEDSPTLILHSTDEYKLSEIEVCAGRYANVYGIHPGSSVADLLRVREEYNEIYGEPTYLSVVEQEDGFVHIYTGFDEDFIYFVPKKYWLGGESFKSDAVIERVAVVNAVG